MDIGDHLTPLLLSFAEGISLYKSTNEAFEVWNLLRMQETWIT